MVTHAASFVFLTQGKRIGKKKKTSVKSCNLNPYWNESFVFLIDEMDMKRVWLDVTVSSTSFGRSHCAAKQLLLILFLHSCFCSGS